MTWLEVLTHPWPIWYNPKDCKVCYFPPCYCHETCDNRNWL